MRSKRKSDIKERRVYFGNCSVDGGRYQSYKRSRIKAQICAKHRRAGMSKDQIPLFDPPGAITTA